MLLQFELNIFDLLMGETETVHFYDFGTSGRVPGFQNQLFLCLETPGHLTKSRTPHIFQHTIFYIGISKFPNLDTIRKDGHRKMMNIRLNKSSKS